MAEKTLKIRQVASPIGRKKDQRQTLIGLGLNKCGRISELKDTPEVRGMVAKINHLVEILEPAAKSAK